MSKYELEAISGNKRSYANANTLKELDEGYKYTKSLGFEDYEIKVIYNRYYKPKEDYYESAWTQNRQS